MLIRPENQESDAAPTDGASRQPTKFSKALSALMLLALPGSAALAQNYQSPTSLTVQSVAGYYDHFTTITGEPELVPTQSDGGTVALNAPNGSPTLTIEPLKDYTAFVGPNPSSTFGYVTLLINNTVISAIFWGLG